MKRALVAAIGAAAFMGAGATGALAGEVKGPPGVPCSALKTVAIMATGLRRGLFRTS